jgi:hypothetical protein
MTETQIQDIINSCLPEKSTVNPKQLAHDFYMELTSRGLNMPEPHLRISKGQKFQAQGVWGYGKLIDPPVNWRIEYVGPAVLIRTNEEDLYGDGEGKIEQIWMDYPILGQIVIGMQSELGKIIIEQSEFKQWKAFWSKKPDITFEHEDPGKAAAMLVGRTWIIT